MSDVPNDQKVTLRSSRTRDRIGGGVLVVIGLLVAVQSLQYNLGSMVRMGPGVLPLALGVLLTITGAAVVYRAENANMVPLSAMGIRPGAIVLASILALALIVDTAGLIPATAALVAIAAMADNEHTLKSIAALFIGLSVFVWLIFVVLIGIPFRLVIIPF